MLAWAANAYQNGDPDDADMTLRRASDLSTAIATDEDFWKLKFELVFNKEKRTQEDIAKLFEASMTLIAKLPKDQRAIVATEVAQRFHLQKLNEQAVNLMEAFYAPLSERIAGENNDIAYFRSLAKKNLDVALKEIDAALIADGTSRKEYLDTKAWVLHGLHRDEEALRFANEAIAKLATEFRKKLPEADQKAFMTLLFPEIELQDKPAESRKEMPSTEVHASDESSASQKDGSRGGDETKSDLKADLKADAIARGASPLEVMRDLFPHINPIAIEAVAKQIASLRFHRACILDELGRYDESDLDYAWLDRFGFTNTSEIF